MRPSIGLVLAAMAASTSGPTVPTVDHVSRLNEPNVPLSIRYPSMTMPLRSSGKNHHRPSSPSQAKRRRLARRK